jgi:hypothetical protein
MTLEEEAAVFTRKKKEAEKKARQRAGLRVRQIVVHDETCIPTLVAMGFLREIDAEDDTAINDAFAAFIRHYCHNVKYSKQVGRDASVQIWYEEEDRSGRKAEREEQDRRHLKRLEEGGFSDWGLSPDHDKPMPYIRRSGDNRPIKTSPLPPMKGDRKRGGAPNGRNPGLLTATVYSARGEVLGKCRSKPLPRNSDEKIKPMSAAAIRKAEKKIEEKHGPLVEPDKSIHTHALSADEIKKILF